MAATASAKPKWNNQVGSSSSGQKIPSGGANAFPVNSTNSGGDSVVDLSLTKAALRHNSGIASTWTSDELSALYDLLAKYTFGPIVIRYSIIARNLMSKTVRDVALRCRWMTEKENGKRRNEDLSLERKSKARKERATDYPGKSSSHLTALPSSYAPSMISMDNDDGIPHKAIGGVTGEILEQNSQLLNQISANFSSLQIDDNINLLSKTRENILALMKDMNDMPEVMKQMPPLPVKLNEKLAKSILPH